MAEKTEDWEQYVQQTAELMGLTLTPESLPEVVDNFERIAAIASLVTEFELDLCSSYMVVLPVCEPFS